MRTTVTFVGGAAALYLMAGAAAAADNEAGVPLQPSEAAGRWTIETKGQDICTLTLGTKRLAPAQYDVSGAAACNAVLPQPVSAWTPTRDGMAFVGPGGATSIAFNRWSNSLFVSHPSSGVDIQLKRGQ